MSDRIHITTAIFYCNGAPHVGSAYEALAADVFARAMRRRHGADRVSFLSGTDEHGDKIRRAALAEGLAPKTYTDKMSALFRDVFAGLNTTFDYWVRTTDPGHEKFVQEMLTRTNRRGDIYPRDYEGLYCVDCERFYTEKELNPGNVCPAHNRPVELISERNYFLRIDKYREEVREKIRSDELCIRPARYKNEALNMLAEPLADLCISRPKTRLDWGIEIPFDNRYVTYVWYDAFWAYVSAPAAQLGLDNFMAGAWPHTEHFIGKDILKTHAVYWPPILLAAGLPLPRHLNVHGWLNFGGSRMSKSSGNVRDPLYYETTFGPDVLRYFVMREVVYGLDGDFSEDRLIERYNADLANNLGNLVSRVLSMAQRYFGGVVSAELNVSWEPAPGLSPPTLSGLRANVAAILQPWLMNDASFPSIFDSVRDRVNALVDDLAFKSALESIWDFLDATNGYVTATAPFTLAKDPANLPRVGAILANLLEALRVIADTLEPFMPVTSGKILALLNVDAATARMPFGAGIKPGHKVNPPIALFPRIEKPKSA
jgi:methionyl-tRNA synthetase